MKKILFLILLISLTLFSVDLFAYTGGGKEEIDCMGVIIPFNATEGTINIIMKDSVSIWELMNREYGFFVLYSNSADSTENTNIYNFPAINNNVNIGVDNGIYKEPPGYKLRC